MAQQALQLDQLSLVELETACRRETKRHRQGQPSDGRFCLQIFQRAILLSTKRCDNSPPSYADEAARELLYQLYTPFIEANINRKALQTTPHDEMVQQVWLRFWRAANNGLSFFSIEEALSYLKKATVSALLEEQRQYRQHIRTTSLQALLETSSEDIAIDYRADLFSAYAKQRFRDRVRELLADPIEYRIFQMRYSMMLPPREIARILKQEDILIKGRIPTARAVSDLLERIFERLAEDPEIEDLLRSD
jgi:hypothetical protein